jgi:hypothetical protein
MLIRRYSSEWLPPRNELCISNFLSPKPIPWFVSDVTPRDWDAIFHALKTPGFFRTLDQSMARPEALNKMVSRWEGYAQAGIFALAPKETHSFWVSPGGYWEIAPGRDGEVVGKVLDGSGLVIFKVSMTEINSMIK